MSREMPYEIRWKWIVIEWVMDEIRKRATDSKFNQYGLTVIGNKIITRLVEIQSNLANKHVYTEAELLPIYENLRMPHQFQGLIAAISLLEEGAGR
jgi:hypothetical protein